MSNSFTTPSHDDGIWAVINSFFKTNSLVQHQLDSFNEFIDDSIQNTIDDIGSLTFMNSANGDKQYVIHFGKISIGKPSHTEEDGCGASAKILYPHEARLRNLTYS